ncbi:hypothetical protein KXS11_03390 [Plantibacter flavus]|uniref:hypothetical protein n=1 Tax=Plantibacter flavus TaxID=150123 RepID=UPI003F168E97
MTSTTERCRLYRPLDAPHDFDPDSGWCIHGCGHKSDGRLINMTTGRTIRAARPDYQPAPAPLPEQPQLAIEETPE